MGLNKNFAEVRLRYVTSLLLGFVGVLLMITTFSKDFIPMDIFTQDGVRAAYNYGLEQLGGGAVGSSLTRFLMNAIGVSGVYIVILSIFLLVMLLSTKMTITKLMSIVKGQAVKTGESIGETLIEVNRNVKETLIDESAKTRMKKRSLLNLTEQENFDDLEQKDVTIEDKASEKDEEIKIIDFNMSSKKDKPSFLNKKTEEPTIQFCRREYEAISKYRRSKTCCSTQTC